MEKIKELFGDQVSICLMYVLFFAGVFCLCLFAVYASAAQWGAAGNILFQIGQMFFGFIRGIISNAAKQF